MLDRGRLLSLIPGTKLGPYEVLAPLGAGGMGEVYRAKDTRLGRDVAIKVLPSHLSENVEVRARFEREAKTVSSLNHPHICTLFDVGNEAGIDYLVMELVEGESLAQRLQRGAVPIPELLRLGVQIADALDRAHRAGVVHRDLKPGNVMLAKSGAKLMDFGLARATGMPGAASGSGVTVAALTRTPTVASPLTVEGTLVGTFQYMAPEQLEGREADVRSDIWAFGCVLYEMATGKRAFDGRSQATLISSIISSEPAAISSISPMSPPALERIVARCLAKEPDDRWQTASDLKHELQWIVEGGSQAGVPAPLAARRRGREKLAWILAGTFGVAAIALAALQLLSRPAPPLALRYTIAAPTTVQSQDSPRISPDGRVLAYNASDSTGVSRIWIQPMNSTSAQALPGTEDARRPFWSPDSRYLAFIAGGKLKKVPVSGGPPITICDAPNGADGTWGRGGVILYDGGPNDPILRVSASGGVPATAISGDTAKQVGWPEFLPDGKHFLYLAIGAESRLLVGQLGSPTGRDLGACESQVQFVPPGYLLFSRGGSLVVQPFDLRALKIKGEPVPVAEQVGTSSVGGSDFRASDNGALVYSARSTVEGELVELARDGRPIRKIPGAANSLHPKLSPDQRRIAIRVLDAQTRTRDIWLVDLAREITSRFTFEPGNENLPLWSPDGKRIAFVSDDSKATGICVRNVSGSGDRELLGRVSANVVPTDWSPDGATIVFEDGTPATRSDLWLLPLEGDRKPRPFLNGSYNEAQGRFSPDGRYLAYTSDESGRPEIYVQAFPDRSEKWQISTRGGSDPEWSADGRELFYLGSDQQMMSVAVHGEPTLTMELPRALFPARVAQPIGPRNHYAVSRDGQRFFVLAARDNRSIPPVNVMTNWIAELQRR